MGRWGEGEMGRGGYRDSSFWHSASKKYKKYNLNAQQLFNTLNMKLQILMNPPQQIMTKTND